MLLSNTIECSVVRAAWWRERARQPLTPGSSAQPRLGKNAGLLNSWSLTCLGLGSSYWGLGITIHCDARVHFIVLEVTQASAYPAEDLNIHIYYLYFYIYQLGRSSFFLLSQYFRYPICNDFFSLLPPWFQSLYSVALNLQPNVLIIEGWVKIKLFS